MNHSEHHISSELKQACDLTQQIIDLANKTELDELEALNKTRLNLIEKIFNNDKTNIDVALTKKLLNLNEQAVIVIKKQMALNMKKQTKSRKGNVAHGAYMQHAH